MKDSVIYNHANNEVFSPFIPEPMKQLEGFYVADRNPSGLSDAEIDRDLLITIIGLKQTIHLIMI